MRIYILESEECVSDGYDTESIYAWQYYDCFNAQGLADFMKENKLFPKDNNQYELVDYAGFTQYRITVKQF